MDNFTTEITNYKGIILAIWILLLFCLERLSPKAIDKYEGADKEDGKYGWRRIGRNLSLWLVVIPTSLLIVIPVSAFASSHGLHWLPSWWKGATALFLNIIILDLWIYWWHRINHIIPFLWRFHEIHHLDHFLDTSSALRFHFGEVILSAFARTPIIYIFGMSIPQIIIFETMVMLSASFHHSNISIPKWIETPLSYIIITPSLHWIHHHAIRKDTDSTYGAIFSFWDRIFKSSSKTKRTKDMKIGLGNHPEEGILNLLSRPFKPRK